MSARGIWTPTTPIPPGPHDVVISSMTFHHVEHIDPLLAQMFQALKSPGYLCVADLDLDQGEFHEDNTGVFHPGFDRTELRDAFRRAGFYRVRNMTAAEVTKPARNGNLRKFSVFLMIGEKAGR
jgi:ubiquinone/menaquinone biosynthesis C-methylase UbiE